MSCLSKSKQPNVLQFCEDGTSDEQTRDDATAEMKRLLQELNKLEAQNEGQLRQGEVGEEGTERACSQPAAGIDINHTTERLVIL